MNVLIAVDDSIESREAATVAYQFFGAENEYSVLSVGSREPVVYGTWPVATHQSAGDLVGLVDTAIADEALRVAAKANATIIPDAAMTTGIGDPGRIICQRATEGQADVIVIGSHDKGFWERLIDPSVGRYLADNAPCPVLIVR